MHLDVSPPSAPCGRYAAHRCFLIAACGHDLRLRFSLAGREVRRSGEFGLHFEIRDPLAQRREGVRERL